jgi:hypothetical protein
LQKILTCVSPKNEKQRDPRIIRVIRVTNTGVDMNEEMNKAKLLQTIKSRRAEWDAALAEVPKEAMTEPGVAGHWSVKDIVAHINHFEGWIADRMHEVLRGESYTPTEMDWMDFDQQNEIIYEQNRDRPLEDILTESHTNFRRLIEGLEAHSEAFLIEPQQFEGSPEPVTVWKILQGNVYDHYGEHIPTIRDWLGSRSQ